MHCYIYKSSKKIDTYIYLPVPWVEADIPSELKALFSPPQLAMELDLDQRQSLAREEISQVIDGLRTVGYYLQIPPAHIDLSL